MSDKDLSESTRTYKSSFLYILIGIVLIGIVLILIIISIIGYFFIKSKPLIKPNKTVVSQKNGVDLGPYWINKDSTGTHYLETNLIVPNEFKSNHVIFEGGGSGWGISLLVINENNIYNLFFGICNATDDRQVSIKIPVTNIKNFLGKTGLLGWSLEYVKTNSWKVRLFWNNILIGESGIVDMNTVFFTGADQFGYLVKVGSVCYKYNNLSFDIFPNTDKQGPLKLYTSYTLPPN